MDIARLLSQNVAPEQHPKVRASGGVDTTTVPVGRVGRHWI